ncbi:restriction endonuclease subunit S [Rhodobacteraceae bacterium 63075]|nr:restriction endonuclease subunit S [Rhodobacteraceae bacterium 63075]
MKDAELCFENPLKDSKWPCRPLGDVCEVKRGSTITKKSAVPGDVPVVAGGISPAYYHNTPNRPANVITVSGSGANAGYVNFFDVPIWASDCSTVLPKEEGLNVNYVHRYLLAIQSFIFKELARGAAQPHVYPRDLAKLAIPIPPLEEQQRIVVALDEAFEGLARARAHAEANLQNARELVATSTDAFCSEATDDWKIGKMGDFCTFEGGFAFKSGDVVKQSQVQLIRIGNLYQNILDLERKPVFYPDDFAESYSKFRLKAGDIILSLTGTVGKQDYGFAVAVPETDRALLLNQRVARIMPKNVKTLSPNFLLRFLRSGSFLATLYNISRGTRQANLSTRDMAELPMAVPPMSKQLEIVESLDSIDAGSVQLIAAYERSIVDLDELRQSLLQKAFAGELT